MEHLNIAVVADIASSIGSEIAYQLIQKGINVFCLITAESDVEALRKKLDEKNLNDYLKPILCRTHTEDDIKRVFSAPVGYKNLLINYISFENESFSTLTDNDIDKWQPLIDAKLQRMEIYSREAINHRLQYILNISSPVGSSSLCSAWRDAVFSFSEKLRKEISETGKKIKVTTITADFWTGKKFAQLSMHELTLSELQRASDVTEAVMHTITSYKWNATPEIIVRRE